MNRLILGLTLLVSFDLLGANITKVRNLRHVRSNSIKQLFSQSSTLQRESEKEYRPAGGRALNVYRVGYDPKDQSELEAIADLTDKANTFGSRDSEDATETVEVARRRQPTYSHIAGAFVAERSSEKLSRELVGKITQFRARVLQSFRRNRKLVFYKILSSNESQGHLGFVIYHRGTKEALYVSTISDH